jgi:hypothetical protein
VIHLSLTIICVLFIELAVLLGLGDTVKSLLNLFREVADVVFSKELGDIEKEVMIRQASLDVLKATSTLIFKFVAVILALYFTYLLLAGILMFSETEFMDSLYSIKAIFLCLLVTVVYVRLRNVVVRRLLTR